MLALPPVDPAVTPVPLVAGDGGPPPSGPPMQARSPAAIAGLRLGIASPDAIRAWSSGEVTIPHTLDRLSEAPVPGGLCDETIFGALRAWGCGCRHPQPPTPRQRACPRCGVPVRPGPGQRDRFGHIELADPCVHPWWLAGAPGPLATLLDCSARDLAAVLAHGRVMVTAVAAPVRMAAQASLADARDPARRRLVTALDRLAPGQVLDPAMHATLAARWPDLLTAGTGPAAVRAALAALDLPAQIARTATALAGAPAGRAGRLRRRLALLTALQRSGTRPEWLVLTVLPVLPAGLRPVAILPGGQVRASDLNRLYAHVLIINTRLRRLRERGAPVAIIQVEERQLPLAVSQVLANGLIGPPALDRGRRPLADLTRHLSGKHGALRRHALGKRVDYSGRAVIVVGPELGLHQCGLPRPLALELFRPFVVRWLVQHGHARSERQACRLLDRRAPVVWEGLAAVMRGRLVLLNRAPTLHRLSLQAFAPVPVAGQAIRLPPLVCAAFNADFDGDTMAVHLPLSAAAQREARARMWSVHTVRSPANGQPTVAPSQDAVLGLYALTLAQPGARGAGKLFCSPEEVELAERLGHVAAAATIRVRVPVAADPDRPPVTTTLTTTVGRVLLNAVLPPGLRWRPGLSDGVMDKAALRTLLEMAWEEGGPGLLTETAEALTRLGFAQATRAGLSLAVTDVQVPPEKAAILAAAEAELAAVEQQHGRGLLSDAERSAATVEIWNRARAAVADAVQAALAPHNPLAMMIASGARGSLGQLVQLAGMRGLMADPTGRIIDVPIRANFREGLTVLEYFISTHGARKGQADTALRTADAGHLTRRLVEVAQAVVITEVDCDAAEGYGLAPLGRDDLAAPTATTPAAPAAYARRLQGRVAAAPVVDPSTGEVIVGRNEMITAEAARRIVAGGLRRVAVRSPLTCRAAHGLCQACYGRDLATGEVVELGTAVGVIAAQSIGEPGTQLTMRTFHTGGVAAQTDITSGLPRVEEVFEARLPRGQALLAPRDGVVTIEHDGGRTRLVVRGGGPESVDYVVQLPATTRLRVVDGAVVAAGTPLTAGHPDPHALLATAGLDRTRRYLVDAVQQVYGEQGVILHDVHVELIVRRMLEAVRIASTGDTRLLPGMTVPRRQFLAENERVLAQGGVPATARVALLGITRAALTGAGWLAAAGFQATIRVLAEAALGSRTDWLAGLKEHVIAGKRIPAGTGWPGGMNKERSGPRPPATRFRPALRRSPQAAGGPVPSPAGDEQRAGSAAVAALLAAALEVPDLPRPASVR